MFRWEIATAVAGAIIGINPFNQPDVEASKIAILFEQRQAERRAIEGMIYIHPQEQNEAHVA